MLVLFALTACGSNDSTLKRYRKVADFEFTEASGRRVNSAELRGRIWLANFVMTGCSAECYLLGRKMQEVQQRTEGTPDVRMVSFTVDPKSDTPPMLASYARSLKADTNRWLFITGERQRLYSFLHESFLPPGILTRRELTALANGYIHTSKIALVDAQGWVRGYFDGTKRETPWELTLAIDKLRSEPPTREGTAAR
jgi:protein SCO1